MIALANEAMDTVRRLEMRDQPRVVRAAMGTERKAIKGMFWGMRKDHASNSRIFHFELGFLCHCGWHCHIRPFDLSEARKSILSLELSRPHR